MLIKFLMLAKFGRKTLANSGNLKLGASISKVTALTRRRAAKPVQKIALLAIAHNGYFHTHKCVVANDWFHQGNARQHFARGAFHGSLRSECVMKCSSRHRSIG